ncbi:hypothetical protein Pcinc_032529 [Petrolisthes cinctipes]|uniref:Serine/threonine-protein kinase RIO3 n=1 Tax=Petrolisthes cinctipes TaxID=88211 RepID=A0AAE1EU86_PETCI|nr:hypothetical protein Pcinc_032529 [Petrolisthes cinctipes]
MASSAEVAQPDHHYPLPCPAIQDKQDSGVKVAWGGAGVTTDSVAMTSPWGGTGTATLASSQSQPSQASFRDLMSEELAKDLDDKEKESYIKSLGDQEVDLSAILIPEEDSTTNDMMLAQMLQYEFDREYDQKVKREEKHYNGNSKVSVSFNKFKVCPSWYGPDSDDELEDIDDEDRAIDSFEERRRGDPTISSRGYVKQGTNIVTKHDLHISGRRNAERIMNLPPGINTGDGGGFDMQLSNKVYNKLCRTAMTDMRRKQRVHDKVEKATAEMALDPKTRLLLFKMVNNAILDSVSGIISSGKEAVVFHALGGELDNQPLPNDCAVKVFKTTITDFKTRERYIKNDYRFKDRISKNNSQKLIRLWAEKEYHNLRRLRRAQIPSPDPILIKKHVLVMSLIGTDHMAAPKLKEVRLSSADLSIAYEQVVEAMVKMFHACRLVHADLSEYNILWYEDQCWIIDLGQAVEPSHPRALHFLHRDCTNIVKFFKSKGLPNLPSPLQLFEKVSGISLPGTEESAARMIEEYETHQELWREGIKNLSDQFEFLWQEIQADEKQRKAIKKQEEDEEEDEEEYDDMTDERDKGGRELKTGSEGKTCIDPGEECVADDDGHHSVEETEDKTINLGGAPFTKQSSKNVEKQCKKKKAKNKKKNK